MEFWLINILNGIVFSLLLFSLATGFSLVLGVMGILNLAHGAIFMVGCVQQLLSLTYHNLGEVVTRLS